MEKKIVIVTGANRGLGLALCKELIKLDFHVILTARDEVKGREAQEKLKKDGLDCSFFPLEVCAPGSVKNLAEHLTENNQKIYALINNAGVFRDQMGESFFDLKDETLRETLETNLFGPIHLAQILIPLMKEGGHIVNVSSGMGQLSDMGPGSASYRISKTALNAVTRILHAEKGNEIAVNSICPGWCRTDMGGMGASRSPEEGIKTIVWLLSQSPTSAPKGSFLRDNEVIPW